MIVIIIVNDRSGSSRRIGGKGMGGRNWVGSETNGNKWWNKYSVNEHNLVKNSNWLEVDQLAIHKRDAGVEIWTTENRTSWWSEWNLNLQPPNSVQCPNHLATLESGREIQYTYFCHLMCRIL